MKARPPGKRLGCTRKIEFTTALPAKGPAPGHRAGYSRARSNVR